MNATLTIELHSLRFFAFHGLYAEEKKSGNEFEVDLSVSFNPSAGIITDISDTVNYAALYRLLKTEMQTPRHLLETFAMEVTEKIHLSFPAIQKIRLRIVKLHVPVIQFTGRAEVVYEKEF